MRIFFTQLLNSESVVPCSIPRFQFLLLLWFNRQIFNIANSRYHGIAFYQSLRLDERSDAAMQLRAMIDKTMNCTADESQRSTGPVYGDYMDGKRLMVFSGRTGLNGMQVFKWTNWSIGATFFVWKLWSGSWIHFVYAAKAEIVRTPAIVLYQQLLNLRQ